MVNLQMVAVLVAVYFIAGKLGLLLAFVHAGATAVWPPTGIALAACLLWGYRVWPGIFLGAFLVNILPDGSLATTLGIATGNTLEALAGAYLVNRFANGTQAFERLHDVLTFALLAALGSTMVSATFGVTSLALEGHAEWTDFWPIWVTWWLGDAGGALLVAPLLVLWSRNPLVDWPPPRIVEAGLLLLILVLVGWAVFEVGLPGTLKAYPPAFLCVPALVWAAFRFGPRETATANVLLAGIAIWGTLQGVGPFVRETQNESLLLLQGFMNTLTVMALALAAGVGERQRVIQQLQDALEQIKTLRGLVPICATCKKIRTDQGYWDHIERYIEKHSLAQFTHGLCPECLERLLADIAGRSACIERRSGRERREETRPSQFLGTG